MRWANPEPRGRNGDSLGLIYHLFDANPSPAPREFPLDRLPDRESKQRGANRGEHGNLAQARIRFIGVDDLHRAALAGRFAALPLVTVGLSPYGVAAGDLDSDGVPEYVVTKSLGSPGLLHRGRAGA